MKSYQNFIIQLTADKQASEDKKPHKNGLPAQLFACVTGSPAGHQNQSEATPVDFPTGLDVQLEKLKSRELDLEGLISLGEALAGLLLPLGLGRETRRSVRDLYHLSRAKLKPEEGLRIQIRAETASLGNLPWEYVYVGNPNTPPSRRGYEGFLALDREISIVRYENHGEPEEPAPRGQDVLRVTVMLADLRDPNWPKLNLDQEEVNLLQALEGEDGIELTMLRPGSRDQLEKWVSTAEGAEVFHFSGHGEFELQMGKKPRTYEGHGSLILAGDDGRSSPLAAEKLAIELSDRGIRLAVLGACEAAERDLETPWSGVASALVYQGIPAVVGMQYTVRDDNAIAFSRRFYQALAAGKSIDSAVSEGRLGVFQRGGSSERDWGVPVLYLRTDHTVLFPKPMKPIRRNLMVFAAASIVLTAWFFTHIYDLITYKLDEWAGLLGLGMTAIPAAIAMVQSITSTVTNAWHWREQDSWFERCLRHRLAPHVLWSMLGVALLLFFTTNSIYLKMDADDDRRVEIAVKKDGGAWVKIPDLVADPVSGKLQDGGFVLFQFIPPDLEFLVKRPFGFKINESEAWRAKLKFGILNRSIKLEHFGDYLVQDDSRAIRLILRSSVHDLLPDPTGESGSNPTDPKYELQVTFGNNEPIKYPVHQGIIYFGAHQDILSDQLDSENRLDRREQLRSCLHETEITDAALYKWMDKWNPEIEEFQQIIPDAILGKGDSVKVELLEYYEFRVPYAYPYSDPYSDPNPYLFPTLAYVAGRVKPNNEPIEYGQLRKNRFNNICLVDGYAQDGRND